MVQPAAVHVWPAAFPSAVFGCTVAIHQVAGGGSARQPAAAPAAIRAAQLPTRRRRACGEATGSGQTEYSALAEVVSQTGRTAGLGRMNRTRGPKDTR